ncbi:MAG: histidinol dehydrogenase, partial [Clostridiales bacterium]|nr:histidinol dehydrogenase [Clostridiales bacterium]
MIQIVKADGEAELRLIENLRTRAAQANEDITKSAAEIMAAVEARGYDAVREYSLKFDRAEPKEFTPEELQAAYDACDPALIQTMEHAAANIRDYNEHLLAKSAEWTSPD